MSVFKNRIIFFGDSITDADRDYHAFDGSVEQLGHGYVRLVQSGLKSKFIDRKYEVFNRGINGHRTTDLLQRIQKDVIDYKPEFVFIMIGINDVWRNFDAHYHRIDQVSEDEYAHNYEKILSQLLDAGIQPVVASAFYLEPNKDEPMRKMTDAYNARVKALADKYNVEYIDVQHEMDTFMVHNSSYVISWDRVHLNHVGAHYLANIYLNRFK